MLPLCPDIEQNTCQIPLESIFSSGSSYYGFRDDMPMCIMMHSLGEMMKKQPLGQIFVRHAPIGPRDARESGANTVKEM